MEFNFIFSDNTQWIRIETVNGFLLHNGIDEANFHWEEEN